MREPSLIHYGMTRPDTSARNGAVRFQEEPLERFLRKLLAFLFRWV